MVMMYCNSVSDRKIRNRRETVRTNLVFPLSSLSNLQHTVPTGKSL